MSDGIFMIVFQLNGDNYLLSTEHFLGDRFRFMPTCFRTLEDALDIFSEFQHVLENINSPIDPEYQRQSKKLMFLRPVILDVSSITDNELQKYFLGECIGTVSETEVLNVPYQLAAMSSDFSKFIIYDVADKFLNKTTRTPSGQVFMNITSLTIGDKKIVERFNPSNN